MNPQAKFLVVLGLIIVAVGLAWQFLGSALPLGRLPGDIIIRRPGFRFYFPLTTCLLISLLLSLIIFIVRHLGR